MRAGVAVNLLRQLAVSRRKSAHRGHDGIALGEDVQLPELIDQFDAVFIGIGLAQSNDLDMTS